MIDKILYWLTAGLPVRHIALDSGPYLERYYLGQLFGITFYLHRFLSSDTERHLHNHPWSWGRSLVLSGGYLEEIVTDLTTATRAGCLTETRQVRWWNVVNGNTFHRIAKAKPRTWTLFFHGPRVMIRGGMAYAPKHWGFLDYEVDKDQVVFRSYPGRSSEWWKTAPKGRDSAREPLSQ